MKLKGIPSAVIVIITVLILVLSLCSKASSWSWIVLSGVGNSTTQAVDSRRPPPCPSYCLNALGGNVTAGTPVGLWWCQGTMFNNEKWSVGQGPGGSLYVTDADTGTPYCLDVAPTAPFTSSSNSSINSASLNSIGVTTPVKPKAPDGKRQYYYLMVADCVAGSASQRWWLKPGRDRLRRLVTGGNRGSAMYVRAYHPADDSSTYYLLLSGDAGLALSFTQVDGTLAASYSARPALSASTDYPNAVLNGNLRFLTDYQPLPLPSLEPTPLPRPQLLVGYMFILCHWSVEADVSVGSCSAPYNRTCPLPPDWCPGSQNLIFLNSVQRPPPAPRGRIVQTVPTLAGVRYLLVFEMKNPYHYTAQVVQLSLCPPPPDGSPGSAGFGIASNQSGSVWHEFRFTAADNFVNVSFSSEDSTDCGPLIDNIQMYALPADANQSGRPRVRHFMQLVTLVAVGWTLVVVLIVLLLTDKWAKKRKAGAARKEIEQPMEPRILVLSYEQLSEYTQDFKVLIGEGGFGKVYYGEMPDGQKIAVKRGALATGGAIVDGDEAENFRAEVKLLSRVHHRYIVKFLGYCDDKGERMLVFEYLTNKSLYNLLHNVKCNSTNEGREEEGECVSLSWGVRMRIAYQVAYALEYLHHGACPPVLHRDVKSANVLLTGKLQARLADMGISKVGRVVEDATQWTSTMTVVKGSMGYLDPHYLQTNVTSEKSDVYSFGVLLLELVTGRKAITPDSDLLTSWATDVYYRKYNHVITNGHHLLHPHHEQLLHETAISIDHHIRPALATYIHDAAAACAVLDPRLRGFVAPSFVHAAMELAHSCLHDQPRLRPSMVEIARCLRDTQLQFLAAPAAVEDDGPFHGDIDHVRKADDAVEDDDDEVFLLQSSTSDWRSCSQSTDVSGR